MVQLKVVASRVTPASALAFQFLNGTIKRNFLYLRIFFDVRFQFLNGTIKSITFMATLKKAIIFQFLNGTIKSLHSQPQ